MPQFNRKLIETLSTLVLAGAIAVVAGCSGGGGDSQGGNKTPAAPAVAQNQVPVTVGTGLDTGGNLFVNIPTVSVTVCVPGTTVCQTIDNIQVDTASFGLRLVSTAASQVAGILPQVISTGGQPLAECAGFASGFTLGSVRTADVKLGGEVARSVPVQIIGDLASVTPPSGCAMGSPENTVDDLGANGILGIGVAARDCGASCLSANGSNYFVCTSSTNCTFAAVPLAQQVANPVPFFSVDNNGLNLKMDAITSNAGAPSATGTLTFGIGTQANNALASAATVFAVDPFGDLNATVNGGGNLPLSFLDSGSNAYFFNDPALAPCGGSPGFYCQPGPQQTLSASISGFSGTPTVTFNFSVADATTLFSNSGNFAFNNLAGPNGTGANAPFDFGLPFFFGRQVYLGMDQRSPTTGIGVAPFVAF